MDYGERIKELLEKKGMSQKELAKRAHCTEAAISHYIKGDRMPRAAVLTRIAVELNTTVDYIMEGIEKDTRSEVDYATRLIARNSCNMSREDKRKIINLLFGDEHE